MTLDINHGRCFGSYFAIRQSMGIWDIFCPNDLKTSGTYTHLATTRGEKASAQTTKGALSLAP